MVEEQVEVEILTIYDHALLPRDEREVAAQLHQKPFEIPQNGCFQIPLRVSVAQAKKIEQIRIAKHEIGRQSVRVAQLSQFPRSEFRGLLRQSSALVKHPTNFLTQHPHAPSFHAAHLRIEVALQMLLERQQLDEVRPTQFFRQRRDNSLLGKCFSQ